MAKKVWVSLQSRYARRAEVYAATHCEVCDRPGPAIYVDDSDGEYNGLSICASCVTLLASAPQLPTPGADRG